MNIAEILDRVRGLDARLVEDEIYQIVWDEIETGNLDPVAKARSLAEGSTDDNSLRSQYIRHRVRRLKDEVQSENAKVRAEKESDERSKNENAMEVARLSKLKFAKERLVERNESMDRIGNVVFSGFASILVATAASGLSIFVFITILDDTSDGVFAGLLLLVWLVLLPLTWHKLYNLISGIR